MVKSNQLQAIKGWFDYKKLYSETSEVVQTKGVFLRCLVLVLFMFASLFCKWLCIPLAMLSILFIAFENGASKLLYVVFLLPFYNVFRIGGEMFWIAYLIAFCVALLGLQIIIGYISKKEKIPYVTIIIIGLITLYFILPLRPTSFSTIIVVMANIALFAVCYLGKWKFDLKLFTRLFVTGLIFASLMAMPLNHISRLQMYVGQFEAGLVGVYRFCGLDADPNYYSMNVVLGLGLYTLLYIKNRVSFKEFLLVFFTLMIFGFMTISKSYLIVTAIYLFIFAILVIVKNHKNFKSLVKKAFTLLLVFFLSATASISYINYTFKRISWSFAPLQSYDSIIFDIGDCISLAYLKSIELPKVDNPKGSEHYNHEGSKFDDEWTLGGGASEIKTQPTFKTEVIMPSVTVLTTGRSDIWDAYFLKITDGPILRILFGTDASNGHVVIDGVGEVASHNTIIQVMYYYGIVGLLIIIGLVCCLFFKNLKKYKFSIINLLPTVLYCIDLMALDNLTSLRTPIFVLLLSMTIFYGCECCRKKVWIEDKISVVVPVYNSEKTLKACVDSILSQTYQNLEVILINDGSIDKSIDLCNYYAGKDPRVIVYSKENGGVSSARNKGLDLATGKYICFIDSDDYIEQDYLELLHKGINGNQLVICGYTRVGADLIYTNKISNRILTQDEIVDNFGLYYKKDIINSPCNKLYLSALANNRFDTSLSLGEDLLFNLEYLSQCDKVSTIESVGYNYVYTGSTSLTGKFNKNKFEVILKIYKHCIEMFDSEANQKAISTILIRNACGQFRKYFKSKQESRDAKLKYVTEYMNRDELKKALEIAEAQGLKQKISFMLLRKGKYGLLYSLYKLY